MKRALTFSLAAILALPLVADEPKSETKKPENTTSQAQPAPAVTADSPLVGAAKRSGRRGKGKSIVITNDTLKTSKGHITTSNTPQAPLNVPEPKLGPEGELIAAKAQKEDAQRRLDEQKKAAEKKAAAHRERVRASASNQAEDGLYEGLDTDPALAERKASETDATPKSESKPPVQ